MTDFKKGDYVRVTHTLEGEVTTVNDPGSGFFVGSSFVPDWLTPVGWTRTIEKVQPPEPEWVDGDVVRRTYSETALYRQRGQWYTATHGLSLADEALSKSWREGGVDILWKQPAA